MRYGLRAVLITAIISLLTACGGSQSSDQPTMLKPVRTVVVGVTFNKVEKKFPAKVAAGKADPLAFPVSGRIEELPVKAGDVLKRGQLIAALDPAPFNRRIKNAKKQMEKAYNDYVRSKALVGSTVTKEELQQKKSIYELAKDQLKSAQRDLRDIRLAAPYGATVVKVMSGLQSHVSAEQPVVSIRDAGLVDIVVNLPKKDLKDLLKYAKIDPPVVEFADLEHRMFPVKIKKVASSNEGDQTVRVTFSAKAPGGVELQPGAGAKVMAKFPDIKQEKSKIFVIPRSALFTDEYQRPSVWVVNPKKHSVRLVNIKVGRRNRRNLQVLKGLKLGDRVVVAGVKNLESGDKVKLLQQQLGEL